MEPARLFLSKWKWGLQLASAVLVAVFGMLQVTHRGQGDRQCVGYPGASHQWAALGQVSDTGGSDQFLLVRRIVYRPDTRVYQQPA